MKTISIRLNETNPNHHLYNNNGTWFIHYTVHLPGYTKERRRESLKTKNLLCARKRRDEIIERLIQESEGKGGYRVA